MAAPALVTDGAAGQYEIVAVQTGGADHVPFAWHRAMEPLVAYPVLHEYEALAPYVVVEPPPRPPLTIAAPPFGTVGAGPQFVIVHVGAADQLPLAWHVESEPDFVYPVLQAYAAVAPYVVVVVPPSPPLTLAAPAFVISAWARSTGPVHAAGQLVRSVHGAALDIDRGADVVAEPDRVRHVQSVEAILVFVVVGDVTALVQIGILALCPACADVILGAGMAKRFAQHVVFGEVASRVEQVCGQQLDAAAGEF